MNAPLTAVLLLHRPDRADRWLRFGHPVAERRRGRRGLAWFAPGSLFAYVDWEAGDYGTQRWSLSVLRAGAPGEPLSLHRGVRPGAALLLAVTGKAAVHRAFAAIDAVEAAGFDPAAVDADWWRLAAHRLAVRADPPRIDHVAVEAARQRRALLA